MGKKKIIIVICTIAVLIVIGIIARKLYLDSKIIDVDVTYDAILLYKDGINDEATRESKPIKISIKGTFDFRELGINSDFYGEITFGDDVFEIGNDIFLSVAYSENSDYYIMVCADSAVNEPFYFSLYTKDLTFDEMYICGLDVPVETKYSNCYIISQANDETEAYNMLVDMFPGLIGKESQNNN